MNQSKVVLITGGSSGIGLAIAQRFSHEGYTTIITGRNLDKLNDAAGVIAGKVVIKQFDMDWIDQIPEFVQSIYQEYGSIDVLVNNAGINQKKPFVEVTNEDFESIIKTNTTAIFALSREVVKVMLQQESRGNIVHISSMAAKYGIPKVISYSAAKTALEGMTRAMAVELSPMGIRVNAVAPGFIRTPMSAKALDSDPERKNKALSRTPMEKLGETIDVANAVYFLASDQASYITGVSLRVDGGNAIGF
ncbi:MAG: SDR family oxidoreductase [Saprospiraceae bacterium]|nr:SDR family oxidoreductase [Saprospiraceae bacterium]MBP7644952.1 SDR family oxidoreductase [Saprospiraceae bacterium]HMS66918.1 SDR family oxidoreductase [Saprospiraceae bacterium]